MGHIITTLTVTCRWAIARLITLSRLYLTLVAGWAALYLLFGDRWWWLFALNSVAICLLTPLPAILALGLAARRRDVLAVSCVLLVLGAYLYGGTLLPRPRPAVAAGPSLTVMSFNMFGFNQHPEAVVAAVRASRADVVGIQELSPSAAAAFQRDLADVYPYQALDPQPSVFGMGVISRYPLQPAAQSLPGSEPWVGTPQVLQLDVDGTPITLVNVHALPLLSGPDLNRAVRIREAEARTIAAFAADHTGPLIVTGDFNSTALSEAYRIISGVLADSWREAGWGLGGTLPGGTVMLGSREFWAPAWVTRIDYVFHSRDMVATSSRIGPWDGYSDHRPVIATLALPSRN